MCQQQKKILSLTLYWAKNAWSLSKSDPLSWVFAVSKQKSLRCDIWVYTYFFLYDSQSGLSLYLWDSRHNTVLLLTLSLTSHNLPQSFKVMWHVSADWCHVGGSAFVSEFSAVGVSVRCVISSWTGAVLRQHSSSHTQTKHHAPVSYLPLYTSAPPSRPHLSFWVGATQPADAPGSGPHCL